MPQIDRLIHNHIRFLAVVAWIVFNGFDHTLVIELSFQIIATKRTNDNKDENHNLMRTSNNAVKDSYESEIVEN